MDAEKHTEAIMTIKTLVGAGATALVLTACGGGDSSSGETDAAQQGDVGSASAALQQLGDRKMVVQRGAGGNLAGSNLDLPAGFPDDVRLPGDINIINTSNPMPEHQMIMGMTPSAPADVLKELRGAMSGEGWSESAAQEMTPQMSRIEFAKDARMASYTITQNGDTSAIQLLTGPRLD
jgi:hypothetical protein